ncbi:MAG: enoyl-CoA hydratase/isomerase family protein [Dehalococcoidia bacterium]|nr:enoyl-CoA hydratase/isomerase family protein [Dehalococcoidia bacterium]
MAYADYQTIALERRGPLLEVTLNRPEALNSVDGRMHEELPRLFAEIDVDPAVEVVVLTGAGRAFCAGGDMAWLQELIEQPYAWHRVASEGRRIVLSILEARQPVIAKLNGAAVGLGATIALSCDVTFAADTASIGDPHVRVGLVAGDGGSVLWPALIGYARARELLYTGAMLPAPRAAELGLINRCVPAAELAAQVEAFALELATGARRAVQWTKAAINAPLRQALTANLDLSLALEGLSNLTADHREGIAAFRERRPPQFSGS